MTVEVLSTLNHVTKCKLEKLEGQRGSFEQRKASILEEVAEEPNLEKKVRILVSKLEELAKQGSQPLSVRTLLPNIERFLDQSRHDPSVSSSLLKDWQADLEHELDIRSNKYEYASLFGRLVTEWIKHNSKAGAKAGAHSDAASEAASNADASFEEIGRSAMHVQRQEWEGYAFKRLETDQTAITTYLHGLFGETQKSKKCTKMPLESLRDAMQAFEPQRFTDDILLDCINGVLKSGLFVDEKREALVDLKGRTTVLKEMVDVLNMDLESLDSWRWEPSPIPIHMRRQVNGKYRVYTDEEIHQALLLHFIGLQWAVHARRSFTSFFHSGAWLQTPYRSMSRKDRRRRKHFLGPDAAKEDDVIRNERRNQYASECFLTHLPSGLSGGSRDYSADDMEPGEAMSEFTGDEAERTAKSPLAVKQSLLHLATTELLLNTELYGQFTILQSDFKWFGPSLPHSTIFAVFEFFGVPKRWMSFFQKFLQPSLMFAQDGPGAEAQTRQRGIPMSHALSDALGEAVLFCLDFAVNQRTKGADLYRFHDDLWFWGQESTCVEAWKAITEFASIMGLELNREKTGTAQVNKGSTEVRKLPASLPEGQVRWGFLRLDPGTGRWVVHQGEVDKHITELRLQLSACHCVFAWIQAWNSYVNRFFGVNLGQAANCMGQEHVDMVIQTLERVQRGVFAEGAASSDGNVTDHLRRIISERFGVVGVPDGFLYFPVELGGLELRNPLVQLFAVPKEKMGTPTQWLEQAFEEDEALYRDAKQKFEEGELGTRQRYNGPSKSVPPNEDEEEEEFMSLEEYMRFREQTSAPLNVAYCQLIRVPSEIRLEFSPRVSRAFQVLPPATSASATTGFSQNWGLMTPYWNWIMELHGGPIIEKFGGLRMGEKALLPTGLVGLLRGEKVKWQG